MSGEKVNGHNRDKRPLWEQCECCDDYVCNMHGMHAYDCECPDIDAFMLLDIYPYAPGSLVLYQAAREKQLNENP